MATHSVGAGFIPAHKIQPQIHADKRGYKQNNRKEVSPVLRNGINPISDRLMIEVLFF